MGSRHEFDKASVFETFGYIPHQGQQRLHDSTARFRVLACGSRWGKSTAAVHEAIAAMMQPNSLGWVVSNTYEMAGVIFKQILYQWMHTRPDFLSNYSESKMRIRLANGAECYGKSAGNPESLLGRGLDWLIFDECALAKEMVWQQFLKARLIDRHGWALFTSTPKGKGWYWHLFQLGRRDAGDYYSQDGATWDNPIIDKEELLKQRDQWTARWWQQEILGAFIDDSGSVFKNIRSHIAGDFQEPKEGVPYSVGVDLAKHQDWSVITILDPEGHVAHWDRLDQETAWPIQKEKVAAIARKYNNATCYVDSSGIGDPIVDDLRQMGVGVVAVPTAQQKTQLIDALVVAMDNDRITFPELPVLMNELEMFEHLKTGSGRDKYSAPQGFHDDTVISLALAWRGINLATGMGVPERGW